MQRTAPGKFIIPIIKLSFKLNVNALLNEQRECAAYSLQIGR